MEAFILDNINFKLINVLSQDMAEYQKLHNLLFPGMSINAEWIKWYHNRLYHPRTYGAFDNDKLIGIWSVEPRKFWNGSSILSMGRCFAVGIHPDFRRKGLFVELSKYALDYEKQLKQYDYIVGFPQTDREVVGGHFKAGWYPVQTISSYCIENKEINKYHLDAFMLFRLTSFKDIDYREVLGGSFIERASHKNLRWCYHPNNAYMLFNYYDSYIVLKPYGNICHILDVQGEDTSHLLAVAEKLCKSHNWAAVTIWCADNEIYRNNIIKIGFTPNEKYMKSITMIAYNINSKKNLTLDKCHIQTGVEEPY